MTITHEVLLYRPETSALTLAKAPAQHLDSPDTFCSRTPPGVLYREERTAHDLLAMPELCSGCKRQVRRLLRFGAIS